MDGTLGPWSAGYLSATLLMWTVMMAAMMLPSTVPMVRLFSLSSRRASVRGESVVPTAIFLLGYLLVWTGFSVGATILQALLRDLALLSPMLVIENRVLAATVLLLAGLYQFSRVKLVCLAHCQSPLQFLLHFWRNGRSGAVVMGFRHGAYCLGCCWALMLLLFVVGVMNLKWVLVLAVLVLLEKTLPRLRWLPSALGFVFIGWALYLLVK